MEKDFLREIYIKQNIRDEGVRRDQLSNRELIDNHKEYLILNKWHGNKVVKLNREGREIIKPEIQELSSELIDNIELESNHEYSQLIKYILSELNSLEKNRGDINAGLLMKETDWIYYYLRDHEIWNDITKYLEKLTDRGLVLTTRNYVSTGKGELRNEYYCWPQELNEKFDSPNLNAAKNQVRAYNFITDCIMKQEGIQGGEEPSESEKREEFYKLLEDSFLSKQQIKAIIREIPDDLLEMNEEILQPKITGKELQHKLKKEIIAGNKELLKNSSAPRIDIIKEIESEEGETVEFTEKLGYDGEEKKIKGGFEGKKRDILEEICAFANKNGGRIYIGVSDQGDFKGLNTIDSKDRDNIIEEMEQAIESKIGSNFVHNVEFKFKQVGEKDIFLIDVEEADSPIYLIDGEDEEFYVRSKRSSRPYSIQEAVEYITNKWNY